MVTIYYPRESAVNLGTVIPADMKVHIHGVPSLSIAQYKDLMIDMQDAIDLIESFSIAFEEYSKNREKINQAIDDFNRKMYEKWQ